MNPCHFVTHQRALELQKRIYHSLKAETEFLLGKTPESILRYARETQKDFKNISRIQPMTKSQLIQEVRNSDVSFIADFHTYKQSQRTALRITRDAIQPHQLWYIGLELVPSQFQNYLDQFYEGEISLLALKQSIAYEAEWGFPWKNYSPIFEWAQKNRIRLIALDRPKQIIQTEQDRDLHQRDEWAAGIITDLFHESLKQGIRPKILVLYGELHVGTAHLPYQLKKISQAFLKKPLSWITIHQDDDKLYWKLAKQHREFSTEIIKLRKNLFCVFSGTPWGKLQSLVNWAEGLDPDSAEYENSEMDSDFVHLLQTSNKIISELLKVKQAPLESLSIYTVENLEAFTELEHPASRDHQVSKLIQFYITHHQRFYIPAHSFHSAVSAAFVGSPSENGAAELAAIHILRTTNPVQSFFLAEKDDIFRIILENTFGFFGSLVLNPRRKCDLIQDHLQRIEGLKIGAKPLFPQELATREAVLQFIRSPLLRELRLSESPFNQKYPWIECLAARYLGKIIGKHLYQSVIDDSIDLDFIRKTFLKPLEPKNDSFEIRYFSLLHAMKNTQMSVTKLEFL
jgi:hypothetical protein